MSHRAILWTTFTWCVFGAAAGTGLATDVEPAWNLVFILADDMGWGDLACYGSDLHETPEIDQLAELGVRCTSAYAASPVCSPTRASILTGKHPARLNMTIWREAASQQGTRRLLEPITRSDLPLEETTLAEILSQHGYYTAHVGKWHLGAAEYYPQPHGFDVNIGGTLWGAPQSFFYPYRGSQYFSDWRYVPDLEPGQAGEYLTDRLTDKALEIIDGVADRPFYLNLWYHSVHTPIEGKPSFVDKYRTRVKPEGRHRNAHYAAMVESVDQNVGRVLSKLAEKGLAERTIVVFCSDNGGFVGMSRLQPGQAVTNNAPLRSGKGSLYEGGIRVPLIVHWPGVGRQGAVCHQPVTSCDFFPTLLTMMGIQYRDHLPVDGLDVSDLWKDPGATLDQRALYFHYPHYYPTTSPVSAVRVGQWKLIEFFEDQHVELYNLASDPGEAQDVSSSQPKLAAKLRDELRRWRVAVDAQLPSRNPDWHAAD